MFTGNDPITSSSGNDPAARRHLLGRRRRARQFPDRRRQEGLADEVDLVTKYHVDDETSYAGQDINFFFQGHAAYAMKGPWVIPEGQRNFPDMEFNYVPMPPYAGLKTSSPPNQAGARW